MPQQQNFIGGLITDKVIEAVIGKVLDKVASNPRISLEPKDVPAVREVVAETVCDELAAREQHATNNEPAYQSRVAQGSLASNSRSAGTDCRAMDERRAGCANAVRRSGHDPGRCDLGALRPLHRQEAFRCMMEGEMDLNAKPADRMVELPEKTRTFLAQLRDEDIDTLNAGLKLVVATMTVGRFVKWLIVGILGMFAGVVMFGESVVKILAWFRPPPG